LNSYGKESDPNYLVSFERLYKEVKRRYPGFEGIAESRKEEDERSKRRQETVFSKITKEEFLASVMK